MFAADQAAADKTTVEDEEKQAKDVPNATAAAGQISAKNESDGKALEAANAQKAVRLQSLPVLDSANTNTTEETKYYGSFKDVTAVTHISQWSPPTVGGTALVCIGVLEYSKPTWCDQNDLYLMKRYPTVAPVDLGGTKVTNAKQKDEFMVSFVDSNIQKEDIDLALGKMQVEGNERVVKHVGTLETCMNGDVTRNFRMKNGFCGDADGLYKIVPGQSFEKLDYDFNENGLTIKKLFETMRQNECDYLVAIGKKSKKTFTPVAASKRGKYTAGSAVPPIL